jgi:hypothetical protein
VLASGFIADPGLEIWPGAVRVIVLVILAVIPVALLVPLAVRGLPLIVDMDVVVLLAVSPLLMVFRIVLRAPLRSLRLAISLGATLFAVLEVSIGVVVLPVLIAVMRSILVGQDRRAASTFSTDSSFPKQVPTNSRGVAQIPPFHKGATLGEAPPRSSHNRSILVISDGFAINSCRISENSVQKKFAEDTQDEARRSGLQVASRITIIPDLVRIKP